MNDNPTAATVDALAQIWQRILQRSSIGPEESFFDLGGNDPLADSIFAEIERTWGRKLPSATICYAPTIAALAALLDQPALPRFSPLVQLKAGSQEPPILITHGLGGRASFSELAKHICTEHPIYGIQAKGVDGMERPFERIEDMAAFYLDALKDLQPDSSCILIGYSFGGLIALEMAQRLSDAGKNAALLVLIDSYPHPRYFQPAQRLWLFAKKMLGHVSHMKQMPVRRAFSYLVGGLGRRLHIARSRKGHESSPETSGLSFAQTTSRVRESDFLALERYRPRAYRGKIKFVRPEANPYLPNDPTAIWKKLTTELEIETVPGDHLGMVGTHFRSLAEVLTRYVEEVDRKDQP